MYDEELSEIFKAEYSNLIAVLSQYHGVADLQEAEDLVSETFLRAMKTWSHKGIPAYPKAWLRKVAQNMLLEQSRRKKTFNEKVKPVLNDEVDAASFSITEQLIEDSQLRMVFVCCDPELNRESQFCLALRILCGFSIEEIAQGLLSNKETINKKLYRAKKSIKESNILEKQLSPGDFVTRLDNVLRVIYLLFNEGYYSSTQETNIRHDICWEAMRLGIFLSRQPIFPKGKIYALIALMCFHASRIEARTLGANGDLIYEEQDRTHWNYPLIKKGNDYLNKASAGNAVSKYHLEAAIAYWHTQEESDNKWDQILQLYNKLLTIDYSPMIAMNRTYALAKANSVKEALIEAQKLDLNTHHLYHCLLAELNRMNGDTDQEIACLNKALSLASKENQKELIREKLERAFG